MSHRAHLFSLRIGQALRTSCIKQPYTRQRFIKDLLAGITIGIVAIPLAMALAIASGVEPQYGLYTAIIAGLIIPLIGGSRLSVSGPTAAFVVILYPIAQRYGLAGILCSSMLAGLILITLAIFRLGRLIEYIPEAVSLGFTGGIAIVIAVLQVKDLFGLTTPAMPDFFLSKVLVLLQSLPTFDWPSLAVGMTTLLTIIFWPRLRTPVPPHLPALILAGLLAQIFLTWDLSVETIGQRFSYIMADGSVGHGIPPFLPEFKLPWLQPGANGSKFILNWHVTQDLLASAFAIAMLGAIESLLCAVVLDGMTGEKHSANSELLGQGIGNIIAPYFGGITATAAIARSSLNVKLGAESPISAAIHAIVVLIGLLFLTPIIAYLPMPAMAALLIVIAWNMSEAPKAVHLLKKAPRNDIWVYVVCISLTVIFDMVLAITSGILLASVLFVKEIAAMTMVADISDNKKLLPILPASGWSVFKINGPLFFAAADRVFGELSLICGTKKGIILTLEAVPILDAGGLSALNKLITKCINTNTKLYITDIPYQPLKTLARADRKPIDGVMEYFPDLIDALKKTLV